MDVALSMFATWLGAGLTWALTATPSRLVNPGYFRTCSLVVLGLLVLALVVGWTVWNGAGELALLMAAIASYGSFIAWTLERPRAGKLALAALSLLMLAALVVQAGRTTPERTWLALAGAAMGAALLGSSLGAMLLGHYYLTAPWMSLTPLRRLIGAIFVTAAARGAVAAVPTAEILTATPSDASLSGAELALYLGVRWVVGIAGPLVLAVMAWKTLHWKATQAATGILYVVVICTLIGEVAAIALSRVTGAPL